MTDPKEDDSDLADLLGHGGDGGGDAAAAATTKNQDGDFAGGSSSSGAPPGPATGEQMAPLMSAGNGTDVDVSKPMKQLNDDANTTSSQQKRLSRYRHVYSNPNNPGFCDYLCGFISLCCHYHPWFCGALVFGCVGAALMMAGNLLLNPVEEFGVIHNEELYWTAKSKVDLSMGRLDHWCLQGDSQECSCEDPLTPSPGFDRKNWTETFKMNKRQIRKYEDDLMAMELDVAFLGSSTVEEMDGRWVGKQSQDLQTIRRYFFTLFQKATHLQGGAGGGRVEGVALGIAGDTCPNVLYRIMHGEMPDHFNPKVWWYVFVQYADCTLIWENRVSQLNLICLTNLGTFSLSSQTKIKIFSGSLWGWKIWPTPSVPRTSSS